MPSLAIHRVCGGAVALAVLWRVWRPLLAATVNVDSVRVAGLRPERARLVFGLLMAAIIAVAIKIVGVLLIVALLVIPATTMRRFSSSPERMAIGAATAGIVSVASGLLASAEFDTSSDPSIVVTALALFVLARIRRPRPAGGARRGAPAEGRLGASVFRQEGLLVSRGRQGNAVSAWIRDRI